MAHKKPAGDLASAGQPVSSFGAAILDATFFSQCMSLSACPAAP